MNQSTLLSNQGMPIKIEGVGRYLPERVVTNAELEKLCGLPENWIEHHNGVRERRWADRKRETNAFMGARAAEEALIHANLSVRDVDLIINASGTTQQLIPETAPLIQHELGFDAQGIACMSVSATCLSFLVALDISASLLLSGRYQRILIVTSDIASAGLNFDAPESSTLLGDAAAAVVVSRTPLGESAAIETAHLETYSEGAHLTEVVGGGTYMTSYEHGDDNHSEYLFKMQGLKVLRMAKCYLPPFLERLRPCLSTSLGDINVVVPHQASLMGLKLLGNFNWPSTNIVRTIDFLGNTVAASIPTTLYEAVHDARLQRGQRVLLLGTGAGLSIGGVILTY